MEILKLFNFFAKKKSNKKIIKELKANDNIGVDEELKVMNKSIKTIERPKICCIDIEESDIKELEKSGFNIQSGTLGTKINIPNKKKGESHNVLPNYDIPKNLHEFDITIVDLGNDKTIDYQPMEHNRDKHTGISSKFLYSPYPETIFNPKPFGSSILQKSLDKLEDKEHLIITFLTPSYKVEYQTININIDSNRFGKKFTKNIYTFQNDIPLNIAKDGEEVSVCDVDQILKEFLTKYSNQMIYNQTFTHLLKFNNDGVGSFDKRYKPLLENLNDDIVSMLHYDKNKTFFYFPQVKDKSKFLNEFLSEVAPSLFSNLFPNSTQNKWKEEEEYWLPNHKSLIEDKQSLIQEYEQKLQKKEKEIISNLKQYSFLHKILTETGNDLVTSIIQYLKWVGFGNITDMDETKDESQTLEEDIQIEFDNGLLIIECKGIGGTSKDCECSQISKIKHRRCEEREKFDVFALYIVNHQRHKAPLTRTNPPFTKEQITDAKHDKRGLLSTWQLYNLYFDIEKEILTKKEAREILLEYGLIEFKPKNLIFIYEPKKFYQNNIICSINIEDIELKVDDILFIERNNKFSKVTILDIQENGKSTKSANNGKFGLKLNQPIKKNSKIWKKII
jgi:hypothetical protein